MIKLFDAIREIIYDRYDEDDELFNLVEALEDKALEVEIKREDARNLGLLYYFTGKSCKNGHVDFRYTKGGACRSCRRVWEKERVVKSGKKMVIV